MIFWDELNISKKVREIQSTRIHYENNNIYSLPFSRSVGVSPTPRISPVSSMARCCVVLWIFHTKNSMYLTLSGPCQSGRQICRRGGWSPPNTTPQWWRSKKSWLCDHQFSPAPTFGRRCLGPTGDLFVLIWLPCAEKSFLQIQRYALVYPREKNDMNVMPEKTYSCFSNRSPIQTTRGPGGDEWGTNSRWC